jgi:hypothetical protein
MLWGDVLLEYLDEHAEKQHLTRESNNEVEAS